MVLVLHHTRVVNTQLLEASLHDRLPLFLGVGENTVIRVPFGAFPLIESVGVVDAQRELRVELAQVLKAANAFAVQYLELRGLSRHQKAVTLFEFRDEAAVADLSIALAEQLRDFLRLELHVL